MDALEMEAGPENGVRFIQQGNRVLIIWAGKLAADLDWESAVELADALKMVAKRAEEWAKASDIALDQAILIRSGAPNIGFTNHPTIQKEAAKEAAYNSTLRRSAMKGIKSEEQVGTPTVIRGDPPK